MWPTVQALLRTRRPRSAWTTQKSFWEQRLREALGRLNPKTPAEALNDAFRKLTRPAGTTLEARNRAFHRMMVDGVTVEYRTAGGALRWAQVSILDYESAANNDWLAVNQFTVADGEHERRPDIVLFVNGLPLGLIELKNPADEKATVWTAWQQIQTYKAELANLFVFNAILIASDGVDARIGTLTAGGSGTSLGARSPARRWLIRVCPSCGSCSKECSIGAGF